MDDLRLSIGSALVALNELAAADGQIAVVEHNAGEAAGSTLRQRERAASDGQLRIRLILDSVQTAVVGTAGDGRGRRSCRSWRSQCCPLCRNIFKRCRAIVLNGVGGSYRQ